MAELEQGLEELKVVKQAFKNNIDANDVSTANVEFRDMPNLLKQMEKKLPAQTKNVNPTTDEQTITADSGYKLSQVNIKAVKPSDYYKPEQSLSVTPKTTSQTLTPSGNSVYNQVNVSAVTSAIDGNIIPTNIRKGTSILGVQGNLEADKPDQQKTVNPTTSQQVVVADSGYELAKVTINAVTSSIDSNIQASNIKKGTTILGVTGTLESTGSATVTLQEKSINPTTTRQSVTPDAGYDGLSKVNVEAVVPSQYYKPEEVANVTPMTTTQVVTPSSGAVFSSVNVSAVNPADYHKPEVVLNVSPTESVQNFVASNNQVYNSVSVSAIPSDYVGSSVQRLGANTYVPSTTDSVINAGQYLNGQQTIKGDSNLIAENIKEGVSLFGVVGTHKGGAVSDSSKFDELVDGSITELTRDDLANVTEIRYGAFITTPLVKVEIPSNVKIIGGSAFTGCESLTTLVLDDGIEEIGQSAFSYVQAKDIVLPKTISVLKEWVFEENYALESITIPENITEIKADVFRGCTNLTEITMESMTPPSVTSTSFPASVTAIYVKYGAYDTYKAQWSSYASKIVRLPAIPSTITVTVNNYLNELVNGASVTITGNGQTFTGTTNENGVFVQGGLQPATYTISVADMDGYKTPDSVEVVVEENTQNSATFTYLEKPAIEFSRTFSENTPAVISQVSAEMSANNMTSEQVYETYGWSIGDTISYQLTTGENVEMRIIGFNHDNKSDGSGKAGITLEMTHCLATKYKFNDTNSNKGGYAASLLKTTSLPSIKSTIPQEWRDVIKLVDKKSANGGGNSYTKMLTLSEDIFLLAEIELFGVVENSKNGTQEGKVYEYWNGKANSDRIKMFDSNADGLIDTATTWWLRSAYNSMTMFACDVEINGRSYADSCDVARGISFAFCV